MCIGNSNGFTRTYCFLALWWSKRSKPFQKSNPSKIKFAAFNTIMPHFFVKPNWCLSINFLYFQLPSLIIVSIAFQNFIKSYNVSLIHSFQTKHMVLHTYDMSHNVSQRSSNIDLWATTALMTYPLQASKYKFLFVK